MEREDRLPMLSMARFRPRLHCGVAAKAACPFNEVSLASLDKYDVPCRVTDEAWFLVSTLHCKELPSLGLDA